MDFGAAASCTDAAVETRWYDLVLRAAMVALLVGVVVTLSFRIGPRASGNLAVFPIVLSSIMIILHHRVGGPATAAVMANAVIGLGGFAVAVLVLNLTAEPFGSALALALALLVSVVANLMIYGAATAGREMSAPMGNSLFWYGLALKIAMTASIVVAASIVVERSGPFIGSLIAALPTAGGAAMIILALEHLPEFIAASAVGSLIANAACALFALHTPRLRRNIR